MRVRVYAVDQDTGEEKYVNMSHLSELIETSDDEYADALNQLEKCGRYYIGGGAAQLFLLFRVREG